MRARGEQVAEIGDQPLVVRESHLAFGESAGDQDPDRVGLGRRESQRRLDRGGRSRGPIRLTGAGALNASSEPTESRLESVCKPVLALRCFVHTCRVNYKHDCLSLANPLRSTRKVPAPLRYRVFVAPIRQPGKAPGDPAAAAEAVRVQRLRDDARRPISVNLAETIALSHQLLQLAGSARRG